MLAAIILFAAINYINLDFKTLENLGYLKYFEHLVTSRALRHLSDLMHLVT